MTLPAYAMNRASFPEMYERELVGPLFRPFVDALLDSIQLAPGDRVLDIACGTGIVARVAKERVGDRGHVAAVDLSPQMLAVAKRIAPAIDWREGNAAALPVGDDEKFDVVTCHQGIQFFPDRAAAAREMRRVLAPNGRVAVGAWLPLEATPVFREADAIARRHLGDFADQRYAFGIPADLEKLLLDAGFRDVRVQTVRRNVRFTDGMLLLRMNAEAMVGMSAAGKAMSDDVRAQTAVAIASEGAAVLQQHGDGHSLAFEMGTLVGSGRA